MSRKLAKLRALTWPEKRLLLKAWLLLPLFWLGLRLLGLQRLQAWLDDTPARPSATSRPPHTLAEMAAMGALVNTAARHALGPATCLTRSLLLRWLLRRRGVESDLRIGVNLDQDRLDAHAWVEVAGVPINDSRDVGQRFAAFSQPLSPEAFNMEKAAESTECTTTPVSTRVPSPRGPSPEGRGELPPSPTGGRAGDEGTTLP